MNYRQGWKALNRLLHQDRSFSGRERNCAFLNLKGQSFADISAVSGFDLLDDARAVVASDWDFDGDLDLWMTARTAPRLRLLQNQSEPNEKAQWVAIRLEGDGKSVNRDAVGARCELMVTGSEQPLTRGVHGGDAFLSQTSSWLHFGLGDATGIASAKVIWPGGAEQVISGLTAGAFYTVRYGAEQAEGWQPPGNRKPLQAGEAETLPVNEVVRVVLQARMAPPSITLRGQEGATSELGIEELRGPLLVNLWSSDCPNCRHELAEWTAAEDKLRAAGLRILALDTDRVSRPDGDNGQAAREVLADSGFSFDSGTATAQTVRNMDLFQRAILDRWMPMPVPTSFLLDSLGRVAVIYKGPVSAAQLLADLPLLSAPPARWREAALPFPGLFISKQADPMPLRVNAQFVDHGEIAEGVDYLKRYAQVAEGAPDVNPRTLGDVYFVIATLTQNNGQNEQALDYYRRALAFNGEDFRVLLAASQLLIKLQRGAEALPLLERAKAINAENIQLNRLLDQARSAVPPVDFKALRAAVAANPKDGGAHLRLADALRDSGDIPAALTAYRETLRNAPRTLAAAQNLSWILAAHPDETHRNPAEALALADRLNQFAKGANPAFLDLLAVAHAANGNYEMAVQVAEKCIEVLGDKPGADIVKRRLELFKSGKPFLPSQ